MLFIVTIVVLNLTLGQNAIKIIYSYYHVPKNR
jgi:hypothetical protein